MKRIRPIIKYFSLTAVILLMGQVPIGRNTVGSCFLAGVKAGCTAGVDAVKASHWYASISDLPVLSSWLKGPTPPDGERERPRSSRPRHTSNEMQEDGEKITSADRDSLIRLLE